MADLSARDIERANFVFSIYDFEGNGTVDAVNLGDMLRALNLNPTLATVEKLGGTKKKNEKKLKVDEFLPIFSQVKKEKEQGTFEDFLECLKLYDKEENGKMMAAVTFKKTVAMHEVFLTRLASHSVFREDHHLHVFLEYDQDLCARPKGKLQQLGGIVKSIGNTTDQYYLNATVRDVNDFFEQQMNSLTEYHNQLKEATTRTDKMTEKHKELADSYIKISGGVLQLANNDPGPLDKFLAKVSDTFERARKVESRVASDQDLKLADTLRYYMRDSQAARALLVRRLKCLVTYENANRTLEKARHKNKDIHAAEAAQSQACEQFEAISAQAKEELLDFKTRRLHAFRKSLIELAELEIKHARTQQDLLKKSVQSLRELL